MSAAAALRTIVKLVVVVVVGGIMGIVVGKALAVLTEDGSARTSVTVPMSDSGAPVRVTDTASASAANARPRPDRPPLVRVLSAVVHPASTSLGKRRRRARLSVHVRVTNRGTSTLIPSPPALLASGQVVVGRIAPGGSGNPLREPLQPSSAAQGRLLFETAGAVTARMVTSERAQLRIAGRTVSIPVKIGNPVSRPARATAPRSP